MTEQTIPKVTPNMVDCSKRSRENIVLRDVMQQRNRKHHRDDSNVTWAATAKLPFLSFMCRYHFTSSLDLGGRVGAVSTESLLLVCLLLCVAVPVGFDWSVLLATPYFLALQLQGALHVF